MQVFLPLVHCFSVLGRGAMEVAQRRKEQPFSASVSEGEELLPREPLVGGLLALTLAAMR